MSNNGLSTAIPSPLYGTTAQTLTSSQTLNVTGAWTPVPGFTTVSFTGAVADRVVVQSKGTASATSGTLTTDYFHILHTQPDASTEAPFVSSGSTPNIFGTFVLTQAGTHTLQLRYYFTGAAPTITFNPGVLVAGFPISYAMFTVDHRSSLG